MPKGTAGHASGPRGAARRGCLGGSEAALTSGQPSALTACARPRGERRAKAARELRCPRAERPGLPALSATLGSEQSPDQRGTRLVEGASRKRGRLEELSSDGVELLPLEAFKKRLDVALGVLVIAVKVVICHRSGSMILEVLGLSSI